MHSEFARSRERVVGRSVGLQSVARVNKLSLDECWQAESKFNTHHDAACYTVPTISQLEVGAGASVSLTFLQSYHQISVVSYE